MGRNYGSKPHDQAPVVVAFENVRITSRVNHEHLAVFKSETKEAVMAIQKKTTQTTDVSRISIRVKIKEVLLGLTMVALLVLGYKGAVSPSAITHSPNKG